MGQQHKDVFASTNNGFGNGDAGFAKNDRGPRDGERRFENSNSRGFGRNDRQSDRRDNSQGFGRGRFQNEDTSHSGRGFGRGRIQNEDNSGSQAQNWRKRDGPGADSDDRSREEKSITIDSQKVGRIIGDEFTL